MSIRKIDKARDQVRKRISDSTDQSSLYSRGLSREGFLGGYEAALQDVLSVLRKCPPSSRPEFWATDRQEQKQ